MDHLKNAYSKSKNAAEQLDTSRINLGRRELLTIELLGRELGFDLSVNQTLLDLGCADRFLAPACIERRLRYKGLDYSDVDFEIDQLPIDDESVDIAVSLAVIEHLRTPDIFIREIYRCLRPGGIVYLSSPNFQLDWKNFYNDPTHVKPYTPAGLEALLNLFGFHFVSTFPGLRCKPIHWYHGSHRFLKAYYLLPFRGDTRWPVPSFLKGHARSIFALGVKPFDR